MTTVRFLGAYKVDVSPREFQAALECHDDAEYVARELGSLALVELEVRGMPSDRSLIEFKQPHTKYVPYDETYFELEALKPLAHNAHSPPAAEDFRVAFYLHFFDPDQPLETPWGNVTLAAPSDGDAPPHLRGKSYVFWE
jgi:hypothetical protein